MNDSEDLAPLLEELATTLDALRAELDGQRPSQPRRVRELLQFTEQYTIPAVIALLETNIRLLELTAGAIRLADGRVGERAASSRGDVALDTLERALDDLGGALRGDPTDPDARRLLDEARDLRGEVQQQLRAARDSGGRASPTREEPRPEDIDSHRVPVRAESEFGEGSDPVDSTPADPEDVGVDVDAELESIKRELGGDETDASDDPADDGSDERDDTTSGEN